MTVEEAKELKRKLEVQIAQLINGFRIETNTTIEDIIVLSPSQVKINVSL